MAAAASSPSRRRISNAAVSRIRAPLAPIGWPSATAPPFGVTIASSTPSMRVACTVTPANASLISTTSRSSVVAPIRFNAFSSASAGTVCSDANRSADIPYASIRATGVSPSRRTAPSLATTTAHAPSLICDALPAVTVPSSVNAGRSVASRSTVVSARMPSSRSTTSGSPLRCGTETRTTSSSNRPASHASAARACERAAQASCSARSTPNSRFIASVPSPIWRSSNAHHRPSWIIVSSMGLLPSRCPSRARGMTYGALVIDSMPPATASSSSPARIIWSAVAIAARPDGQTLFTVSAGTSIGMPAATAACRAVIWPCPACRTCPMIVYSTWSGATPARSSAPAITVAPSSTALRGARPPWNRPIGVRTPATRYETGMDRVYRRGPAHRASTRASETVRDRLLDDLEDVVANELVALQQGVDERGVDVAVLLEHGGHPIPLGRQDILDLLLGLGVGEHLADEVGLRQRSVRDRLIADQRPGHPERTHHLCREPRRVREVGARAGPRLAEAQFLGGEPAKRDRDTALDLRPRARQPLLLVAVGEQPGRAAPLNDRQHL